MRADGNAAEPTRATLKKYGLDLEAWWVIAKRQDHKCAICRKLPPSGRLHIDHEHRKGYKRAKPEAKRAGVRGLLCSYCNRYRVAKNTYQTAREVVAYLATSGIQPLPTPPPA